MIEKQGKSNIGELNAKRTREQRIEAARKAGKASAAARQARVTMREDAIAILAAVVKKPELIEGLKKLGIEDASPTIQRAILAGQAISAIKGNTKAAEYLRDTCGEKPADRIIDDTPQPPITFGFLPVVKPASGDEA